MTIEDIIMEKFAPGEFCLHQKWSLKLLKLMLLNKTFTEYKVISQTL